MVYVFDPYAPTGYVCRVPRVLARLLCATVLRAYDYAPTQEGV